MAEGDDRLDRIDGKLDKAVDHLASIDVTLARNTDSLQAHMARTAVIEKALLPIRNVYDYGVMTIKIFGVLALLGTVVEGLMALLTYIRH